MGWYQHPWLGCIHMTFKYKSFFNVGLRLEMRCRGLHFFRNKCFIYIFKSKLVIMDVPFQITAFLTTPKVIARLASRNIYQKKQERLMTWPSCAITKSLTTLEFPLGGFRLVWCCDEAADHPEKLGSADASGSSVMSRGRDRKTLWKENCETVWSCQTAEEFEIDWNNILHGLVWGDALGSSIVNHHCITIGENGFFFQPF